MTFAGVTECCTCCRAATGTKWYGGYLTHSPALLGFGGLSFKKSLRRETHGYLLGNSIAGRKGSGSGGAPEEAHQ